MPTVSFIIPAFNNRDTIERTLMSVRLQRQSDWEAIVVDDGSSDDTPRLVARHVREDPRIRLIRQDNQGAGVARNTGLAEARGDWVVFLDSDDTVPPDYLVVMLDAALRTGADLVHCGWRRKLDGVLWWNPHPARPIDDPVRATARGCPFAIHAAMTRRESIVRLGGFDPALRICEDFDLWQRLARTGARFAPVEGLWVDVHVRSGSLSGDSARHLADGFAVIRRGHGPDPRVSDPAPGLADGAPLSELPEALWYHALWMAGAAIGRGADLRGPLLDLAAEFPFSVSDRHSAAAVVEDALVVGAARPGAPWPTLWDAFGEAITALFDGLGAAEDRFGVAAGILRLIERRIVAHCPPGTNARIGSRYLLGVDLADPVPGVEAPGIERLHVDLLYEGRRLERFEMAVTDGVRAHDLGIKIRGKVRGLNLLDDLWALRLGGKTSELGRTRLRTVGRRMAETQSDLDDAMFWDIADVLVPERPADGDLPVRADFIARIFFEERDAIARDEPRSPDVPVEDVRTGPELHEEVDYTDEAYWEDIFSNKDPWDYSNPYEALKYDQTMALLDGRRFDSALEIACAEGEFTRRLAETCDSVLATDIAPSAVERAARKLAGLGNVTCQRLDLLRDDLVGQYDLIVCSEVLYYLEDEELLGRFAAKVVEHLRPGGWFVTAHACLASDEPGHTGFDWPHPFGSRRIGTVFANTPGLALDCEFSTPIYRIQRFVKVEGPDLPLPEHREGRMTPLLPQRIARMVKWRGGREVPVADAWHDFPILMYHRIVADGPPALAQWRTSPEAFEAQLSWLWSNGWQGISLDRMAQAMFAGMPLPEKSVMLTFDDATRDFLDSALPLLHRYGFPATLFVPTGKIGGAADWDGKYGEPAPILDLEEIVALQDHDVSVCSHGVRHLPLTALDTEALFHELIGSKVVLEHALEREVNAIAYPYGDFDWAVGDCAGEASYAFGFTCFDGFVTRTSHPLVLPRREVVGGIDLAAFARIVGGG